MHTEQPCFYGWIPTASITSPPGRHPLGRHSLGRHPRADSLDRQPPPPGRQSPRQTHTPQAETPLGRHPKGRHPPTGRHPPRQIHPPSQAPPLPKTATPADGTHPTGMYSCYWNYFSLPYVSNRSTKLRVIPRSLEPRRNLGRSITEKLGCVYNSDTRSHINTKIAVAIVPTVWTALYRSIWRTLPL